MGDDKDIEMLPQTDEERERLIQETPDVYEAIRPYLTDYISTVVPDLFRESARYDAKYERDVSFPAHVITAVLTGATLYLYNQQQVNHHSIKMLDVKILCTALTLHDVQKFWNEKTGTKIKGNYRSAIEKYFETDPFHLKQYFPDWNEYFDDIVFLVQHAQESDEAEHESRYCRSKFGKLLSFVKIGDKVASWGKSEYSLPNICKELSDRGFDAHHIVLPDIPQQLFSQVIYRSVKRAITDGGGIPLLLSPHGILYLAPEQVPLDPHVLEHLIGEELIQNIESKPNISDRKFDIAPLLSIPLDVNTRFTVFLNSVRERTESGLLSVLGKTTYPADTLLQEAIACLSYFIYNDKRGHDWTSFPKIETEITDQRTLLALRKIGEIRQHFPDTEGVGGQKCKAYSVHEIVQRSDELKDELLQLHPAVTKVLRDQLSQECSVLDPFVQTILFLNKDDLACMDLPSPKGGTDVCFMCGAPAHQNYKPGKHFIQSGGFTKSTTLQDQYKRYCDACQIEFLLLNRLIENSSFNVREDLLFFYFYFDYTFANLDAFRAPLSRVAIHASTTKSDAWGINFTLGDFRTPFHIKPMAIRVPGKMNKNPDLASKTTWRARAIHTALKMCTAAGCRCIVTAPYSTVKMQAFAFSNEMPTRLEKTLKLDTIKSFAEVRLRDAQLDFINRLGSLKGLFQVQEFKPIFVIPFAKRQVDNFEPWVVSHGDDLNALFRDDGDMEMKTVAQKGAALFGTHRFGGTHKKVKIFRTTLESLMNALSQGFSEDEAVRFASAEVMKDVLREQYSKKKGKDIPAECLDFVSSVSDYLKDKKLLSVNGIVTWENSLTDLYEFEYILVTRKDEKNGE
ncbi:hypothetical protein RJ40_11885 [Methanofollis aquaemaris]|uniref:Type I-D CRISPR-associated protein Cas10d/Csc3 n=1 Tax=Methanofollis aquaemaris TaxID=126734 RepID=A0A8A3S7X5_9EURY|nr:hypothetical protein [Methanofollis aquaemaris]QSZ68142.1 hypothetical protein RJ40_11885 [Methanofollis aquaemaris]